MSWTPITAFERDVPIMNWRANALCNREPGWDDSRAEYWNGNVVDDGEDFSVMVEAICRDTAPVGVDYYSSDEFGLRYEFKFNRYLSVKIEIGYRVDVYDGFAYLEILNVSTSTGFEFGSEGHSIEFANAGQNELFEVIWTRDSTD